MKIERKLILTISIFSILVCGMTENITAASGLIKTLNLNIDLYYPLFREFEYQSSQVNNEKSDLNSGFGFNATFYRNSLWKKSIKHHRGLKIGYYKVRVTPEMTQIYDFDRFDRIYEMLLFWCANKYRILNTNSIYFFISIEGGVSFISVGSEKVGSSNIFPHVKLGLQFGPSFAFKVNDNIGINIEEKAHIQFGKDKSTFVFSKGLVSSIGIIIFFP
ncbi:MAG: hypothetical protein Kow0037_19320 [Calditrichia bacterium]